MTDSLPPSVRPRHAGPARSARLLCDHLQVRPAADGRTLSWTAAIARAPARAGAVQRRAERRAAAIDGRAASLDDAVAAAASLLRASRQPLFGGLGTDVAGARALYRLACATGAICDAAQGAALMHGLRALQDRGAVHHHAGRGAHARRLIVFVGGLPLDLAPLLFDRLGIGERAGGAAACRRARRLGAETRRSSPRWARPGVSVEIAAAAGRPVRHGVAAVRAVGQRVPTRRRAAALAARLRAARYGVLVGAPVACRRRAR